MAGDDIFDGGCLVDLMASSQQNADAVCPVLAPAAAAPASAAAASATPALFGMGAILFDAPAADSLATSSDAGKCGSSSTKKKRTSRNGNPMSVEKEESLVASYLKDVSHLKDGD